MIPRAIMHLAGQRYHDLLQCSDNASFHERPDAISRDTIKPDAGQISGEYKVLLPSSPRYPVSSPVPTASSGHFRQEGSWPALPASRNVYHRPRQVPQNQWKSSFSLDIVWPWKSVVALSDQQHASCSDICSHMHASCT